MRIVLWDIDGTLIKTGGAGMRAMARAVHVSAAAAAALKDMRLDGMTDYKIARALCAARRHSVEPSRTLLEHAADVERAEMDALLKHYLDALAQFMASADRYEVLPGVVAVMDQLDGLGVVHALGTGNLEQGARLKLEAGGLWARFRFGGFGSDAEERPDLLRAARRKAAEHLGRAVPEEEFVVVGDTPRDVTAAHEAGLACVGVATGRYSVAELAHAGADAVLPNLADPDAAQRILTATRS